MLTHSLDVRRCAVLVGWSSILPPGVTSVNAGARNLVIAGLVCSVVAGCTTEEAAEQADIGVQVGSSEEQSTTTPVTVPGPATTVAVVGAGGPERVELAERGYVDPR